MATTAEFHLRCWIDARTTDDPAPVVADIARYTGLAIDWADIWYDEDRTVHRAEGTCRREYGRLADAVFDVLRVAGGAGPQFELATEDREDGTLALEFSDLPRRTGIGHLRTFTMYVSLTGGEAEWSRFRRAGEAPSGTPAHVTGTFRLTCWYEADRPPDRTRRRVGEQSGLTDLEWHAVPDGEAVGIARRGYEDVGQAMLAALATIDRLVFRGTVAPPRLGPDGRWRVEFTTGADHNGVPGLRALAVCLEVTGGSPAAASR
jgi:hypothetical protein